jgi:hypothetical protein
MSESKLRRSAGEVWQLQTEHYRPVALSGAAGGFGRALHHRIGGP